MDRYHETPPMSTYLVAFAVGDLDVISSDRVRIFARKDAINQTKYALEIAPKILSFFEQYFDLQYPLPKLDLIALPDFACSAMENWGAVIFRYGLQNSSLIKKMYKIYYLHVLFHEKAEFDHSDLKIKIC